MRRQCIARADNNCFNTGAPYTNTDDADDSADHHTTDDDSAYHAPDNNAADHSNSSSVDGTELQLRVFHVEGFNRSGRPLPLQQ